MLVLTACQGEPDDTAIPLPEHPRPDFMRDAWDDPNGQRDFALDPDEKGEQEKWSDQSSVFNNKIIVPFSWAATLSGIGEHDIHIGWYARNLEIPGYENWAGKPANRVMALQKGYGKRYISRQNTAIVSP